MRPLLQRIAVNGIFVALLLALIGYMFAELGALWVAGSQGARGPVPNMPTDPIGGTLRWRVPLAMAGWGFLFVAAGELVLHLFRRNRAAAKPTGLRPDTAEVLLDDLMRQAEAAQQKEAAEARATSENSRSPEPVSGARA